jgi:hypothetical protein
LQSYGVSPGTEVAFEIRARHIDGSYRRPRIQAFNRLDDPVLDGLVADWQTDMEGTAATVLIRTAIHRRRSR